MKQKVSSFMVIVALLAAPLTVVAAGQNTQTVDKVKARAAEFQAKRKEVIVKLRAGAKVFYGDRTWPFEFVNSGSLNGRIKEVRGEDFTFSESVSPHTGEHIRVIRYADVLSIKHQSAFEKALRTVGRYSLGVALVPVALPLSVVLYLQGVRC